MRLIWSGCLAPHWTKQWQSLNSLIHESSRGGPERQQSSAVWWRSSFLSHPEKAEPQPQVYLCGQRDGYNLCKSNGTAGISFLGELTPEAELWKVRQVMRKKAQRLSWRSVTVLDVQLNQTKYCSEAVTLFLHEDYKNHEDSVAVCVALSWFIR